MKIRRLEDSMNKIIIIVKEINTSYYYYLSMLPGSSNKPKPNSSIFSFETPATHLLDKGMQRIDDDDVYTYSETDSDLEMEYAEMRDKINQMYESQRDNFFDLFTNPKRRNLEVTSENYYTYSALQTLDPSEPTFDSLKIESTPRIHICAFHVNLDGKYPFLQFFMQKKPKTDETAPDQFTIPKFKYKKNINSLVRAQTVLDIITQCYFANGFYKYVGHLRDDSNDCYLFFDCSEYDIRIHDLYRRNDVWLLTMSEIINSQMVCGNFPLDPLVTNFFTTHPEFIYLQNKANENYELPIIAYVGCNSFQLNFISTCKVFVSEPTDLFGPYYYFYGYQHAVAMAKQCYLEKRGCNNAKPITIMNWLSQPNELKGGLVRVALFPGATKFITTTETDYNDNSQTTQDMLNEYPTCATMAHRQLVNYIQVSDRGGNWTSDYDTIFLGDLDYLDKDACMFTGPMYVVRDYEQQLPLSCHYFDIPTMETTMETSYIE